MKGTQKEADTIVKGGSGIKVHEEFGPEHAKAMEVEKAKQNPGLGDVEIEVLNHLADAYNMFVRLYELHPSDQREFEHGIHALQNMVMGRVAYRTNPELFK